MTKAIFKPTPRDIQNAPEPYSIRCRADFIRQQSSVHLPPWLPLRPPYRTSNRTRSVSLCGSDMTKPYLSLTIFSFTVAFAKSTTPFPSTAGAFRNSVMSAPPLRHWASRCTTWQETPHATLIASITSYQPNTGKNEKLIRPQHQPSSTLSPRCFPYP